MARLQGARQVKPAAGSTEVLGEDEGGNAGAPHTHKHTLRAAAVNKRRAAASFVCLPLFRGGEGETTEN